MYSTRNQLKRLKIYQVAFLVSGETIEPTILSDTFPSLSKLTTLELGLPFIAGNNIASTTILRTAFQYATSIKKLILYNHVGEDNERIRPQEFHMIVDFIRHSKSLKYVSFDCFYWEENNILGGTSLDFGLVGEAIRQSASVAEIAFHKCDFHTPAQIEHLKSVFDSPDKPLSLTLGRETEIDGAIVGDFDENGVMFGDYDLLLRDCMIQFFIDLMQSSSGLCELDIGEFVESTQKG
jgi:hypothetical protein